MTRSARSMLALVACAAACSVPECPQGCWPRGRALSETVRGGALCIQGEQVEGHVNVHSCHEGVSDGSEKSLTPDVCTAVSVSRFGGATAECIADGECGFSAEAVGVVPFCDCAALPRCMSDADCGSGSTCRRGRQEDGECTDFKQCFAKAREWEYCGLDGCDGMAVCEEGLTCTEFGMCEFVEAPGPQPPAPVGAICCLAHPTCPAGSSETDASDIECAVDPARCEEVTECCSTIQCKRDIPLPQSQCKWDSDCGEGLTCMHRAGQAPACEARPVCMWDSDCAAGWTCLHRAGQAPKCEERPTQYGCTMQCGTLVAHGYRGQGEGADQACNTVACNNGELTVLTRAACSDAQCPATA